MFPTDPPRVLGWHPLHQRRGDRAQVRLRQEVRAHTGQLVPALRGDGETHAVGGGKVNTVLPKYQLTMQQRRTNTK